MLRNYCRATRNTYRGCILFFNTDFYEEARCGWVYIKGEGFCFALCKYIEKVIICKIFFYLFLPKGKKNPVFCSKTHLPKYSSYLLAFSLDVPNIQQLPNSPFSHATHLMLQTASFCQHCALKQSNILLRDLPAF